ncbi:helix-turn-helix domain-containing protein [Nocardia sp. NPDC057272]|uniref:AlbA family DNA-binding domain-containing protein n=1 Tax=Nocardia sp. NPDC057272 TaxID=3346079 RepID=UPI0036332071
MAEEFTALHRVLGRPPGPITVDMIDDAVRGRIEETSDLDWKSELPAAKAVSQGDFPKDVAAMANSGGGMLVFGVKCEPKSKAANERVDVHELSENHERALRSAAVTAVSPPVFGLQVTRLKDNLGHCVVVAVPPSIDGPHLVYRGEYFGAPIRNDADTVWMRERQIEAMYRTRLDTRRHNAETLSRIYGDLSNVHPTMDRAWLIAVAQPRIPSIRTERLTREAATELFQKASDVESLNVWASNQHPLRRMDIYSPRPGLRRWTVMTPYQTDRDAWRAGAASIHFDGSVTLAVAIGGELKPSGEAWPGAVVQSPAIEDAVAVLMALIRTVSGLFERTEYEIRIGIEFEAGAPIEIYSVDSFKQPYADTAVPLPRFAPVDAAVDAGADADAYLEQARSIALDCVNQGGAERLHIMGAYQSPYPGGPQPQ